MSTLSDGNSYGWPAIAWTGSAAIIAAIDSGGDLHYWWQANGTTEWHKQFVASGLSPNVPATIAWTGTAAVIAAVDSSGSINYWWQANGATQWNPQLVAQAGITVEPWEGPVSYGPPAIAATDNYVGIVAVDSYGNVNYWQQAMGTTPWNQTVLLADGNNPFNNSDIASTGSSVVITAVGQNGNLYFLSLIHI